MTTLDRKLVLVWGNLPKREGCPNHKNLFYQGFQDFTSGFDRALAQKNTDLKQTKEVSHG